MFLKEEPRVKKLVLVSATFMLVITARKETVKNARASEDDENPETTAKASEDSKNLRTNLTQILYIQYFITFWKKFILVLLDLGSEVNAIYLTFTKELRLLVRLIDVGAQKIDNSILDIYEIVIAAFSVTDNVNRVRFFE